MYNIAIIEGHKNEPEEINMWNFHYAYCIGNNYVVFEQAKKFSSLGLQYKTSSYVF